MARITTLLISLVVAWLLWSGLYKGLLLTLGAASCLLVVYLARRMRLTDEQIFTLDLAPRILGFWAWLFKEIVKSNLDVARVILDPRLPIEPRIIELESDSRTEIGQALLGNSITLTPGSVTLDVHRGRLRVHCLTPRAVESVLAGSFNRRVRRVIGA